MKAWERAPVAAHAPRLQGHKIWKKVGVRSQQDKENHDAAQAELEKEGAGARKKLRMTGTKENIGDAPWQNESAKPVPSEGFDAVVSVKDISRTPLKDSNSDALQFIPRKRTNTNHVITPRKQLRKITVNEISQNSGKKSAQHITKTIPLNDRDSTDPVASEKPARRRKSLRKSTRRLTRGDATAEAEKTADIDAGINISEPPVAPQAIPRNTEEPTTTVVSGYFEETQEQARKQSQETVEDFAAQKEKLALLQQALDMIHSEKPESEVSEARKDNSTVQMSDMQSASSLENVDGITVAANEGERAQLHGQSIEVQPTILPSIESGTRAISASPSKAVGTPKGRKRGGSHRRGSRRSTRTTRASSARAATPQPGQAGNAQSGSSTESIAESNLNEGQHAPLKNIASTCPDKTTATSLPEGPDLREAKGSVEVDATSGSSAEVSAPSKPDKSLQIPVSRSKISIGRFECIEAFQDIRSGQNGPGEFVEVAAEEDVEGVHGSPEIDVKTRRVDASGNSGKEDASKEPIFEMQADLTTESEIQLAQNATDSPLIESSPVIFSPTADAEAFKSDDQCVEIFEVLEPISISRGKTLSSVDLNDSVEDLPETSTPDPTTTDLVEAISQNAPPTTYDHDDTDMLRNFLTRVKANKAAKAGAVAPKRKRSLPHSPLRLPLGEADPNISPSAQQLKDEFDVSLPSAFPSTNKRKKRKDPALDEEDMTEPKSIRRSGRTRLPVKAPLTAPSFIPIRRLGQDEDTTVTLRRSEEKELAALTRVNTRKNKGGSLHVAEVLARKAEEKDDPAARQRALKEIFDEKTEKGKKEKKGKSVLWAEELAQYQSADGKKIELEKETDSTKEKEVVVDEKKSAVRVGVRSKIALGMGVNGTPAPKRRMRGRQ